MSRTEIRAIDPIDLDQKLQKLREENPGKQVALIETEALPITVRSPYPVRKIRPEPALRAILEISDRA